MLAGIFEKTVGVLRIHLASHAHQPLDGLILKFGWNPNDCRVTAAGVCPLARRLGTQLIGLGLRKGHGLVMVVMRWSVESPILRHYNNPLARSGVISMARKFPDLWPIYRCVAVILLTLVTGVSAMAFPKPAGVPYRWELNFEPGDLRLYTDPTSGDSFWYFTYTVTNRTGKDQLWAPKLILYTDGGEILEAGKDVPTRVTQELLTLLGNQFLEDQNSVIGDLLQGKEHAKEGLVIWKASNTQVNEMSLFVRGISGETAQVKNPVSGENVTLYKTLQRDYLIPGDAKARGNDPIGLVEEQWVMR